jgi:dTMP kinase
MRGKLFAFEGPDGGGKSTQARFLEDYLTSLDHKVIQTREPGSTPTGEHVRATLLDPSLEMTALTELFLFYAARNQLIEEVEKPALARGDYVIKDRGFLSSFVYQGVVGGVSLEKVTYLTKWVAEGHYPDMTCVIDIPATESIRRARKATKSKKGDRFENRALSFHRKIRKGYRLAQELLPEMNIVMISGKGSTQEVFERVKYQVDKIL